MLAEALATFTRRKKLENTYSYGGGIVTILASGKDTAGAFSLLESMQKPGSEPPMHSHQNEDELFYILEGVVHLTVDGVVHELSQGEGNGRFSQVVSCI